MATREYPSIPKVPASHPLYHAVEAINKLLLGRGNNIGTFDLAADPNTTTTVLNNRFESTMVVNLTPMTEAAATSQWRVTSRSTGSFVVTHLPITSGTATFMYEFRG